jgi:hypothetical protein
VLSLLDSNTSSAIQKDSSKDKIVDQHIFTLLKALQAQGRLPAIFFSLDR